MSGFEMIETRLNWFFLQCKIHTSATNAEDTRTVVQFAFVYSTV